MKKVQLKLRSSEDFASARGKSLGGRLLRIREHHLGKTDRYTIQASLKNIISPHRIRPPALKFKSPRQIILQRQYIEKKQEANNRSYDLSLPGLTKKEVEHLSKQALTSSKLNKSYDSPKMIQTLAEENLEGYFTKKSDAGGGADKFSHFPKVKQPLRIELPAYFNTPRRKELPENFRNDKRLVYGTHKPSIKNATVGSIESEERMKVQRRLQDYKLIAFACKRANKPRDEGRAYYSMGVLYDNICMYSQAINCYHKFLAICKLVKDAHGEALAYNCIGVNNQLLGEHDDALLHKAISFHNKHKELSDIHGKLIAHINLGLLYESLKELSNSTVNYQFALKYALLLSSPAGQSVALANLSQFSVEKAIDTHRIKLFAEQYLNLCNELNHKKAEGNAHLQLGKIYSKESNFAAGAEHFHKAFELSKKLHDDKTKVEAACNLGVTGGSINMEEHFSNILATLKTRTEEDKYVIHDMKKY